MTFQWVSADLATGVVIADLPTFEPQWPLSRVISDVSAANGVLELRGAPENWRRAVQPGASVLACYDDSVLGDGSQPQPIVWAGYVPENADIDYSSDEVPVSMLTLEGYLDRRFVTDVTYSTSWGWRDIAADVVARWVIATAEPTIALGVSHASGGATPAADIVMQNADNATVKTRLDQLCAQFGGEYTIRWSWTTAPSGGRAIFPTLYVADMIGSQPLAGLDPAVTFEMPGTLAAFTRGNSYASQKGANKLVAYSSGQGSATPYAAAVYAADFEGRPTFEERYQPAPSISPTALAQYARQAILIRGPGSQPVTMTAATATDRDTRGRRLGVDWDLGDTVGYRVAPADEDGRLILAAQPNGESGTVRVIGVSFDDETVAMTVAETDVYVSADS